VAAALVDVELVESLARSYLDEGIGTDPGPVIARDRTVLAELEQALVEDQGPIPLGRRTRAERLSDEGVPSDEAVRLALREDLDVVPAVAVLSGRLGREPREVLRAFRRATEVLDLDGLERQLDLAPLNGPWAETIRGGVFDDMVGLRATVVERALGGAPGADVVTAVDRWLADRGRPLEGVARLRHEAVDGQPPRLEGVAVVVRALRRALDR
jgi:NAD-specific glutamate dehydrogenase